MNEYKLNPRTLEADEPDKVVPRMNFFIIALAAAVIGHLFFLQGFLLVVPSKEMPQDKGFIFLGSILDSSQMTAGPLTGRSADNEQEIFSRQVPVRSEREYFEGLKDVAKPRAGVFSAKREVKSVFPTAGLNAAQKNIPQWNAGESVEYQSLRLPDFP